MTSDGSAHISDRHSDTILIVGAYDRDRDAADALSGILTRVEDGSIEVHGATIVHRRRDGRIGVDGGSEREPGHAAGWGALAGATVGILFPPSLLAGALVGGTIGLAARGRRSHGARELSDAIANTLPPGSCGVIAIAPAGQIDALDGILVDSRRVTKSEVDEALVTELRAHAAAASV